MSKKSLILLFCVSIIFVLGISMVFNTSSAEILDRGLNKSTHYALIKQMLYAILGTILAVGIWFLGYESILRLSGFFLLIGTVGLILVFIPGIGQHINGAHRWLGIGGYSLQPSEFIKYLIPIHYIHVMTTSPKAVQLKEFLKLLFKLTIPIALILIEPDNGTTALILSTFIILFLLTRIRWFYWVLPLMILCIGGGMIAYQMPHVSNRILVYLHPELDLQGKGHQPYQAKIAAGSGGILGKGLGESLQKLAYLPYAHSDYIAAIFGEEFGFLGITFLIILYMVIGYCGFSIALETKQRAPFYMVVILTYLICFQAFLNLGVVSGLLPSKGINLPFFSQGGSSLLANFMVICIILNIHQTKKVDYVIE